MSQSRTGVANDKAIPSLTPLRVLAQVIGAVTNVPIDHFLYRVDLVYDTDAETIVQGVRFSIRRCRVALRPFARDSLSGCGARNSSAHQSPKHDTLALANQVLSARCVILSLRIGVLSSRHNNSLFRVRVHIVSAGNQACAVQTLISEPLCVVSKPGIAFKNGDPSTGDKRARTIGLSRVSDDPSQQPSTPDRPVVPQTSGSGENNDEAGNARVVSSAASPRNAVKRRRANGESGEDNRTMQELWRQNRLLAGAVIELRDHVVSLAKRLDEQRAACECRALQCNKRVDALHEHVRRDSLLRSSGEVPMPTGEKPLFGSNATVGSLLCDDSRAERVPSLCQPLTASNDVNLSLRDNNGML